MTLGGFDAATGGRYLGVRAENVTGAPCALDGVPGLVFRAGDPDVTTRVDVTPVRGAGAVPLVPDHPLDVLDGAEVRVGPWVQAADGWS